MRRSWWSAGFACVVAAAGCEPVAGPEPEPVFFATLAGAVDFDYTGTGTFRSGSIPRRPPGVGPQHFQIESYGTGGSRGMHFSFLRSDLERPAPGVYPLGSKDGFSAHFVHGGVRASESVYRADGGELVITESTSERLEGTFRFEGLLSCRVEQIGPGAWSCTVVPDGERIEVSGSFSAVRSDQRTWSHFSGLADRTITSG